MMRCKKLITMIMFAVIGAVPGMASAEDSLTGDTRLACEAVLCLATGTIPNECSPSLRRYFSISYRRLSDTIRGRSNFLHQCPVASQTPQMTALTNAQANGAGRCDASSLNSALQAWSGADGETVQVSNQMPDYCIAYTTHPYTDLSGVVPKYVGIPDRGGYWVEAGDYDRALAEYNARISAENEARLNSSFGS